MSGFTPASRLGDVLDHPAGRAAVQSAMGGVINSPMVAQLGAMPIGVLVERDPVLRVDEQARNAFWARLGEIDHVVPQREEPPKIDPDPDYEGPQVKIGSADLEYSERVRRFEPIELTLHGPVHGNPFVDVELHARFAGPGTDVSAGGFYDGDGTYRIRFLPEHAGEWSFRTRSTARSLDGHTGTIMVAADAAGPGPVRVADTYHFAHADGTRHLPLGTTAYAWIHQPTALQQQTLQTLAASPFTKIRMCLFPKSYLYNTEDPERFPFQRTADGEWDLTRFDVDFFRLLEERIRQLNDLGIQADLILFHPYDRWGFSDLGRAADDRYVSYVVRRLAASANVWWSLANEYDLIGSKSVDDWERLAELVVAEDPVGHLRSIHNCFRFYDHDRPWVTHCSLQRVDVYRTAENTDTWRERWRKPIVIDECGYEGDLDQGWGNLTGEELTRRFWEGAVRGGYVGHGETYHRDDHVIWWSKGGALHGTSAARIAFLRKIIDEVPGGVIEPLPSEWDAPWGGVAGCHVLIYFGFNRPSRRTISLPGDGRFTIDVIDTWNMTIDRLDGTFSGTVTVPLPARQYLALRLTHAAD